MATGPVHFTTGGRGASTPESRLEARRIADVLNTAQTTAGRLLDLERRVTAVLDYCNDVEADSLKPPSVPAPHWVKRVRVLLGEEPS